MVSSIRCSVQHHEQNPTFSDEIKLSLPITLKSSDHLLFSFSHVSVANVMNMKSSANEVTILVDNDYILY